MNSKATHALPIIFLVGIAVVTTPAQAVELSGGVRARSVFENSTVASETDSDNTTLGVTVYVNANSRNRRNDLRFRGQLDFSNSDVGGSELNPRLYFGNVTNIVDNSLLLDVEISLYRRNLLDSIVSTPGFESDLDGVQTLSYRFTPTYSINVSRNTQIEALYSFQGSREIDSTTDEQSSSNAVEIAWLRPAARNRLSWAVSTGYKYTEFSSSDEQLEVANATLTLGFYPRRRWFIGGLISQEWEYLSQTENADQSSSRWKLITNWQVTQRISTSASIGERGSNLFTSQLELNVEGPKWNINLGWSRSASYSDFVIDPFSLLTEQNTTQLVDDNLSSETPDVLDLAALTLIEQRSVDEKASIGYLLSGRRSRMSTELFYLTRSDPADNSETKVLSLRAGFFRDVFRNWTVGIQHETQRVRSDAGDGADYTINSTELSLDIKF